MRGLRGHGGLTMLMGELATAVKYKLPVKIVLVKNNSLGQIRWEQMAFLGNPEYGCELSPIDFAAIARSCGATGFSIADAKECGTVIERALATPGPVVVDALVDSNEPPMPGSISLKHAAHFAEGIGQKGRGSETNCSRTHSTTKCANWSKEMGLWNQRIKTNPR